MVKLMDKLKRQLKEDAFSDTYQVGQTIMNQSGQSITGFFLTLVVYLTMSLIISLFMNLVNNRFQLVTR